MRVATAKLMNTTMSFWKITLQCTPGPYILSYPPLWCILSLQAQRWCRSPVKGGKTQLLILSTLRWVSVGTTVHDKMKLLCPRLRAVLTYGHNYLEGSLNVTPCPFSKISLVQSSSAITSPDMSFWPSVQAQAWISSSYKVDPNSNQKAVGYPHNKYATTFCCVPVSLQLGET